MSIPATPASTPEAQHIDDALDEALEESFPASDPVAISSTQEQLHPPASLAPGDKTGKPDNNA
jgi:hypothetical protein